MIEKGFVETEREKMTGKKKDLVVVIDTLNVRPSSVNGLVKRILRQSRTLPTNTEVMVAMHGGLDTNCGAMEQMVQNKFCHKAVSTFVVDGKYNFAYIYLKGLQEAAKRGSQIVEMDSGGGHIPEELGNFVDGLKDFDVVWSSRFIPGSKNEYPLSRKLTSWTVTQLSNIFLGTNLTDASSGFQGFRSDVLNELFRIVPPETWQCVGEEQPFHMYQTEIRALVSWMRGVKSVEVPITYGAEKEGRALPFTYQLKSLICFWEIWKRKANLQKKLGKCRI